MVPQSISALQVAVLAVFVQALSPHKYVGWGVMVVIQIALISLSNLGFENLLYLYGQATGVPLSDMNGAGQILDRPCLVPGSTGRPLP